MMTENKNIIVNDDLLDEELMGMPGLKVSDDVHRQPKVETVPADGRLKSAEFVCRQHEEPKHDKQKASTTKAKNATKPASKKSNVPKDAEYEQIAHNNEPMFGYGLKQVKECAKSTILFGGLSMLFFYWQQTGQMLHSASFPSIIVCALLAGIGIGKAFGKHIKW